MAHRIIPEECISCGACVSVCPVEAISEDENSGKYIIDPEKCTDCGICVDTCPSGAIVQD